MRKRFRRAAVAATLLCVVFLPAAGSAAGPAEELQETEADLEELRDRIDAEESQAGALKERIDALNEEVIDLQIAVNKLTADIGHVRAQVSSARAQISETEREIEEVRGRATEQAVALYKGGTTEALDTLLNSSTLGELNDRVELLGVAAQENTGALIRYGRLKVQIEDQHDELFARQQELSSKLASRQDYKTKLEHQRATLAADFSRLMAKLGTKRDTEQHLEAESEALKAEILAAQAQTAEQAVASGTAVAGAPPSVGAASAQGFIWPLNGGVTSPFGPRGGRMHEGIDIDGYSGQAIVASKSGRVISAGDSGDGYGTKVVLDHGGGFSTLYAHMSRLGVSSGSVSQGQVVGAVGCTGSCTGDHLHFEIRINGSPVNPLSYLP